MFISSSVYTSLGHCPNVFLVVLRSGNLACATLMKEGSAAFIRWGTRSLCVQGQDGGDSMAGGGKYTLSEGEVLQSALAAIENKIHTESHLLFFYNNIGYHYFPAVFI